MKNRLIFLLRYGLYWLVFFVFARLLFMMYHFSESFSISFGEWLSIFVRGIWMDLSFIGYILLLSSLFVAAFFFSEKITRVVFKVFTAVILALFSFIVVADLELYRNWGFRIDGTPLLYLQTPGDAMASLEIWFIALFVLFGVLVFIGFYFLFLNTVFKVNLSKAKWWSIPVFIFLAATMIVPIRGGFGIAPMNPGKVYFSTNLFSNHASLNVMWNLMYSISKSGHMYKEYPNYVDEDVSNQFYNSLNIGIEDAPLVLKTKTPNVVIILLESFTAKLIEPLGGQSGVTPNFTELADDGLLFSNIYASGDRSDKGIVAVVSGFPAQSTQSIIKHTLKASKLPTLSNAFYSEGYNTAFYYGGDPDFANIRSYLYNANFQKLITQDDFPKSYRNSKWGVHDEHVFKRLLSDLDNAQAPFFNFFFTLSSHEPFDIPCEPAFPASSEENKYLSSVNYTDKWLGWFFDEAKTREWFDNTLFILIADHGHRYPGGTRYYEPKKFAIPMLWLGGALETKGVIDGIGSQTDLARTLLFQLGIDATQFEFSRNLLSKPSNPFAYYAFNDGFGFVTPDGAVVWDHVGQRSIFEAPNNTIRMNGFSYFNYYHRFFLGL